MINKNKKTVIYLHRYPIEEELKLCPATRRIIDLLLTKYNVVYVSLKNTFPENKQLRKGIIFEEIPYKINRKDAKDKWIKLFMWYLSLNKIRKIIKKYDAAYIIHKEQLPLIPSVLSRLKIPMLQDIGDWWWTTVLCKYNLEKISETIENIEIRDWNKHKNLSLITHSNAEAQMVSKRGMDIKRIKVVNHPLSKETFKQVDSSDIKKKLELNKDDWVVAVHGITHPSKDYGLLLKWWKDIIVEHPNWILLNIGGTTGEKWYRNEIKKLNLGRNAIITGWIDDPNVLNKYLNVADCLLVTRKNNLANQGLIPSSLWHSMTIGKPLVITGLPGLVENIENGINGYSYTPDNYSSFKETLETMYNDPEQAKKVGKKGIAQGMKRFDPEKCARGYFETVVKGIEKNKK